MDNRSGLSRDPFCGAAFVFRAKRADRIKLLIWDQTGIVLVHKRLEGGKFVWPQVRDGVMRQTLINDDLDAFTRIPAMYGNSIAQLESDVVWGIITSNPAMADGNALFHTTHKNLAGTGAALAVDAVGAARAAMAKQTGLDKKTVLNVRPAFLIVPASLELKAEQLVAQNLVPAATTSMVPQSIRTLAPISEPRLDAASETAWYLAASPNQIDTIEYAYLEGQQGAYIETRNGFDVDGVEIKCRLDFGAKAIDWRGLYKNPGA